MTSSKIGCGLFPKLDSSAFPFEDSLGMNVSIKSSRLENIPTVSSLATATSLAGNLVRLEWNIPPTNDGSMLNFHDSFFQASVPVPNLTSNQGISQFASNNCLANFEAYAGSVLISEPHSGNTYPYQALMKDLLCAKRPCVPSIAVSTTTGCSNSETENFLEEGNYLPYSLASGGVTDGLAVGAVAFTKAYCNNQTISISIRPKDNIFLTSKYWPSNISYKFVLTIALQNFFVENPTPTTISAGGASISSISLLLNRIRLTDECLDAQNRALLQKPFCYIMPYSKCEQRLIQSGGQSYNITSLFSGQSKPDVVCVMFQNPTVLTKGFPIVSCGAMASNTSPDVASLYLKWNGKPYPDTGVAPPLAQDIRTYRAYVDQCLLEGDDVYLSYSQWLNQYTVFVVSLRDDMEKMYGMAPSSEQGSVDLVVSFVAPLANNINLTVVAFTHNKLEISARGLINRIGFE